MTGVADSAHVPKLSGGSFRSVTIRRVYVPAQYDGKTEVSLMVFNDGGTYMQPDGYYRAVNVLDNLIYRRELPVMVAAFIDPGKFTADGRSNRQAEYDPVPDRYSRVVVGTA